jgi:hypothetical protein
MKSQKKDFKVIYESNIVSETSSGKRFGSWSREIDFNVISFTLGVPSQPDWHWIGVSDLDANKDEIPEEMYCVYVRYSGGDTFGSSSGNGQIVGLYKDKELAHALAKSIADHPKDWKPGSQFNKSFYPKWDGYFERLESVEVELIPRDGEKRKTYYPKEQ